MSATALINAARAAVAVSQLVAEWNQVVANMQSQGRTDLTDEEVELAMKLAAMEHALVQATP